MKAFSRDARAASRAACQVPYAPTKLRVAALPWDRDSECDGSNLWWAAKFVTPSCRKSVRPGSPLPQFSLHPHSVLGVDDQRGGVRKLLTCGELTKRSENRLRRQLYFVIAADIKSESPAGCLGIRSLLPKGYAPLCATPIRFSPCILSSAIGSETSDIPASLR